METGTKAPLTGIGQQEIADAAGKLSAYLRKNKGGGAFPICPWLLGQIGYPLSHPLNKEIKSLEKELIDHQPNIEFRHEQRADGQVLLVWFVKMPRQVKKRKGINVDEPLMIERIGKNADKGNGDVMNKEKSSDGYVDRALDALKKEDGQITLKDLAKAMGLKSITGAELGRLRDAAMSHAHVNVYLRSPEEGGRTCVMLEWVENKATVKEWEKAAYGKHKTQKPNETPRREATARSEVVPQSRVSLMSVKFGPREGEEAKGLGLWLTTLKEAVQQVNILRDKMAENMQQKEQQETETLKRRKELIENARGLKIEALQARKDASGIGKQLRKADKEISKVFSQAKNAVRPRKG